MPLEGRPSARFFFVSPAQQERLKLENRQTDPSDREKGFILFVLPRPFSRNNKSEQKNSKICKQNETEIRREKN